MEQIRLQKYLAEAGIASRRKCEEYIVAGKVKVNGQTVLELGTKVIPEKDKVEFNNKIVEIKKEKEYTYILLNKPIDYVTTVKDQFRKKYSIRLSKNK